MLTIFKRVKQFKIVRIINAYLILQKSITFLFTLMIRIIWKYLNHNLSLEMNEIKIFDQIEHCIFWYFTYIKHNKTLLSF